MLISIRDLGAEMQRLRKQRRMTLDDVGLKTGLSKSYLSEMERGKRGMSLRTLTTVARGLGFGVAIKLLGVLVLFLSVGCTDKRTGCDKDDWTCRHRFDPIGEQRDTCVNRKLNIMEGKGVQTWDSDLIRALYEVCEKLYPKAEERKGG